MKRQDLPLAPRAVSFYLTGTAATEKIQEAKTREEIEELRDAIKLFSRHRDSPKRVTYALKVAMEHQDSIKSSLNNLRIYCNKEGLDFDKVLQLNDLNNDVRGYHG